MDQYLDFAIQTAQKAGDKLMEHFNTGEKHDTRGTPKEVKSVFDEVADELIKAEIEKTYPTHSYLTEETGFIDKESEYVWIIDPLDGTGNFVNGNPFFAISISLWKNKMPYLGVIHAPALKESYTALTGHGATKTDLATNKQFPLTITTTSDLAKSYIVFCEGGVKDRNEVIPVFQAIYPHVKDMRKLGSAALELAWVAIGRAEAYVTQKISIWDIAAGIVLVQEAGGNIETFAGSNWDFEKMYETEEIDMVANNGNIKLNIDL